VLEVLCDIGSELLNSHSGSRSERIKMGDRPVLWGSPVGQIKKDLIHVTPTPPFGRIIALDDRVAGGMEMRGGVAIRRVIATADMAAGSANPQVEPGRAALQTFLAPSRARHDVTDHLKVIACLGHRRSSLTAGRHARAHQAAANSRAEAAAARGKSCGCSTPILIECRRSATSAGAFRSEYRIDDGWCDAGRRRLAHAFWRLGAVDKINFDRRGFVDAQHVRGAKVVAV
jgi:hypothetical protein